VRAPCCCTDTQPKGVSGNQTKQAANKTKHKTKMKKSSMKSPLLRACKAGRERDMLRLIGEGADVNEMEDNLTALMLACIHGHDKIASGLIHAGADLTEYGESNAYVDMNTPLTFACSSGHVKCVLALIHARADVDVRKRIWSRKWLRIMGLPESQESQEYTALMCACNDGHVGCVLALIEAKADIEARCWDDSVDQCLRGHTALTIACWVGHRDCAVALIDARANIDHMQGANGGHRTALMLSCDGGHDDCVLALLRAGADVNVAGPAGFTALSLGLTEVDDECVYALLEANASVDAVFGEEGMTVLMNHCSLDGLHLLIHHGAEVNAVDVEGWTPLMYAVSFDEDDRVRALVQAGAAVDATDDRGDSALMSASELGHKGCAIALMEAGADVFMVNNDGHGAFEVAADDSVREVLKLAKPFRNGYLWQRLRAYARVAVWGWRLWECLAMRREERRIARARCGVLEPDALFA
jgi:ankyrin repeat protein